MFWDLTRKDLVDRLQKIRKAKLCCYLGYTCDCKFGAGLEHLSEQTGCPEVLVAQKLLHNMADEEFKSIMERK